MPSSRSTSRSTSRAPTRRYGRVSRVLPLTEKIFCLTMGNSYNDYFFTSSAVAEGLRLLGYTEPYVTGYCPGGQTLPLHVADAGNQTAVNDKVWNVGIIQPQSKELTATNGTTEDGVEAGLLLVQRFLNKAPNLRLIILELVTPYVPPHADVDGAPFANSAAMHVEQIAGLETLRKACVAAFPRVRFVVNQWGPMVVAGGGILLAGNPDKKMWHNADGTHPVPDSQLMHATGRIWIMTGRSIYPHRAAMATYYHEELEYAGIPGTIAGDAGELITHALNVQRFGQYAPLFSTHPTAQAVTEGQDATFTVVPIGIPAPSLQWYFDNAIVPGETGTSYTRVATVLTDTGKLVKCLATNNRGAHYSAEVALTVNAAFVTHKIDADHIRVDEMSGEWYRVSSTDANLSSIAGVRKALKDITGTVSGVGMTVRAPATGGGSNNNGIAGALGTPGDVSQTHWICQSTPVNLDLDGLPDIPLKGRFSGYRINDASIRTTKITCSSSAGSANATYDAADEPIAYTEVTFTPVDGLATITFELGEGNTAGFGYVFGFELVVA